MYARVVAATICCAIACLPVVGAEGSGSAASTVVVHVSGPEPASVTRSALRQETAALMKSVGYSIQWNSRDADAPNLIVLELAGDCNPAFTPFTSPAVVRQGRSLAAASVQDGAVLPFVRVDCAALGNLLAPALAREAPARRAQLYGRAIGRLLAHEMYHVLARTQEHTAAGIGKPGFNPADLLAERFEFETVALDRMRHTE